MSGVHWHVSVSGRCVGAGLCLATAPGSFRLVDGRSAPRRPVMRPDDRVSAAADLCPMEAIAVVAVGGPRDEAAP